MKCIWKKINIFCLSRFNLSKTNNNNPPPESPIRYGTDMDAVLRRKQGYGNGKIG